MSVTIAVYYYGAVVFGLYAETRVEETKRGEKSWR